MRNFNIFMLLAVLSLGVGSSTFATASSPAFSYDNQSILDAVNSVVRIRTDEGSGSGGVVARRNGKLNLITNSHVVGNNKTVNVEFFHDGKQVLNGAGGNYHTGRVLRQMRNSEIDIALVEVDATDELKDITHVPLDGANDLSLGDTFLTCGCSSARWPRMRIACVMKRSGNRVYYMPTAIPGDSGSPIFSLDGKSIVGLTAWNQDWIDADGVITGVAGGKFKVGIAMTSRSVVEYLNSPIVNPRSPRRADPEPRAKGWRGFFKRMGLEQLQICQDPTPMPELNQEEIRIYNGLMSRLRQDRLEYAREMQKLRQSQEDYNAELDKKLEQNNEGLLQRIGNLPLMQQLRFVLRVLFWVAVVFGPWVVGSMFFGTEWIGRSIGWFARKVWAMVTGTVSGAVDEFGEDDDSVANQS